MLILLLLVLSGFCIVFSVVLLLGLFTDNRLLLLPWLAFVSTTTLLDVALSFYFITDLKIDGFVITMYVIDYTLCSINVYCIMCVVSQYQQYTLWSHASEERSRRESLAMATTRNNGDGDGGQGGDHSAIGRIRSWYMRWLSRKTAVPRSEDTVLPCRVVVPADTTYSADEGAVATAPDATGGAAAEVARKERSHLLTPESTLGRSADESSTGQHLCTEETSMQPYLEQGRVPRQSCRETLDDLSVEELQLEAITVTEGIRDHGGGFVPESQPLLDASGSPEINSQKGSLVCNRA